MSKYRGELRVFGLLIVSIVVCLLLYEGLSEATVDGVALGAKFTITGPAALLVTLLLIFSWRGLLTFRVESHQREIVDRPIDKMTLREAERAADDLEPEIKEMQRHQESLRKYIQELKKGATIDVAMAAIGMRPAHRGGHTPD